MVQLEILVQGVGGSFHQKGKEAFTALMRKIMVLDGWEMHWKIRHIGKIKLFFLIKNLYTHATNERSSTNGMGVSYYGYVICASEIGAKGGYNLGDPVCAFSKLKKKLFYIDGA